MTIRKEVVLIKKDCLARDIYSMTFGTDLCNGADPGQFVLLYPNNRAMLLGRPICIADAGIVSDGDKADGAIPGCFRVVFRVIGDGTADIAGMKEGDSLYAEGPLGHGYPVTEAAEKQNIALLGGGLGAPSLLFLARSLFERGIRDVTAVLGYRDSSLNHFLADDFRALGIKTVITTDDGSEGIKGNVLTGLGMAGIEPGLIYACGPLPMLSAVKKYAAGIGADAYISMEERMACGVGVCLGCVTKTVEKDAHSHVNNARVCTEGPVFRASSVDI